jgi:Bacterial SH3 domain
VAAGPRGGTLFADRYRLEHKLTEDDSTTTWQAQDVALERSVRLKMLRPERLRDAAAAEAFRRDVRQAVRAPSPSAKVLDGGDDSATGLPFVVFEWDPTPELQLTQPIEQPAPAPRPQRPPPTRLEPRRSFDVRRLVVLLLMAVPLIAGAVLIGNWLTQPATSVSTVFSLPRPTPASAEAAAAAAATPAPGKAAPAPTATSPSARPTATLTGQRRRIANTDGIGVALRDGPDGQRRPEKGYDEGDVVTLLEQQGRWARIRGDDGREGWVLAVTLVP